MKEQVWSGTGPWVAVLSGLAVLLAIYLVDAWAVLWVPVSMFALFVCFRVRVAQVLSLAMTCVSLLLLGLHWRLDAYPLVRVLLTLSIMLILLSVCFARGHRTTQQLRETGALLDSSLKAMAQGLQVVGPDGRVKLFNDRFCELLDLPRELLERRPRLSELVEFQHARGDFGTNFERVEQGARVYVASHGLGFEVPEGPRTYTRRTPAGRHLQISALPLPGGDVVRTFTDVTHYEQVNEQLQIVLQDHEALRKREMDRSREQLIAALTQLAQYRDNETGQHIVRTQKYIRALARSARTMGYRAEQLGDEIIDMMVKAAPMHDLGKIGVPDTSCTSPGR